MPKGTGCSASVLLFLQLTIVIVQTPGAKAPFGPVQCKPSDSTLQGSNNADDPPVEHCALVAATMSGVLPK